MAYASVTTDAVKDLCDDWADKADELGKATVLGEKQRLEREMKALGTRVVQKLDADMNIIEGYFAQHQANVAKWSKEAEKYLKDAKLTTAKFKKNPKLLELPPQLTFFAKQIGQQVTNLDRDAHEYGDAWKTYRANPWAQASGKAKFPDEYTKDFMTRRNRVINDQKEVGTALEKIKAMHREAESLALIVNKASLKRDIKAGTAGARPIGEAQKIASDGAAAIAAQLNNIKAPASLAPKPESVTQNANTLQGLVTRKAWPKTALEMKNYDGVWKNAEAGYKRIVTIEANMKALSANMQKGLRSTELKDPTVKASLAAIARDIKEASTILKAKATDYAKAKSAYAKVVAGHKATMKGK